MVRSVVVAGTSLPVVLESPKTWRVRTHLRLTTFLLEDPGTWLERSGAPAISIGDRMLLRHGRNTISYLDMHGAWVVCGPWEQFVKDLAAEAFLVGKGLAMASMRHQWQFNEGRLDLAIARLSIQICHQIPGWQDMHAARQASLQSDINDLVRQFLATCRQPFLPERFEPILESYPGVADIPRRHEQDEEMTSMDPVAVEADLAGSSDPPRTALDYWWQSVFTMWWKGFW